MKQTLLKTSAFVLGSCIVLAGCGGGDEEPQEVVIQTNQQEQMNRCASNAREMMGDSNNVQQIAVLNPECDSEVTYREEDGDIETRLLDGDTMLTIAGSAAAGMVLGSMMQGNDRRDVNVIVNEVEREYRDGYKSKTSSSKKRLAPKKSSSASSTSTSRTNKNTRKADIRKKPSSLKSLVSSFGSSSKSKSRNSSSYKSKSTSSYKSKSYRSSSRRR